MGLAQDALECLELPSNLVAQQSLPQLELLQKCNVFVTHGGANSVHEALSFGALEREPEDAIAFLS